jgi:regulator of nucleoside diphosphate kinase
LTITVGDYKSLADFVSCACHPAYRLRAELERASVVPDTDSRSSTVRMGSTVKFLEEETSEIQIVKLVYPGQADAEGGRLSVLTPIGTALIGLSEGQVIAWNGFDGRTEALRVLKVFNPDSAGLSVDGRVLRCRRGRMLGIS